MDKGGVIDAITKVLVSLYEEPEKPSNALEFLQSHISQAGPQTADLEALKVENAELKKQNDDLKAQVEELKKQLEARGGEATSS